LVARDTGPGAPILVVADADDDCPATLGPTLLGRARRTDRAVAVVLAKRELESWFISATLDQPAFSALIDLDQAAGARSFEKLNREVRRLLLPVAERPPSEIPPI
jgi:hypothetical protein